MELEILNKLYLELSQFSTAKTARELELEGLLISARVIAEREGKETDWLKFSETLRKSGIGAVTFQTFQIIGGSHESR